MTIRHVLILSLGLAACSTAQPPSYSRYDLMRVISYPEEVHSRGIGGEVRARVIVDTSGAAQQVLVQPGSDPLLGAAVKRGVSTMLFRPATDGGTPVEGAVDLAVWFEPSSGGLSLDHDVAAVIWKRMPTDTVLRNGVDLASLPSPDEFFAVDKLAEFDYQDLARSLRYPEEARKLGLEGRVVVRCFVDSLGRPIAGIVDSSTDPIFNTVALEAIMTTKFEPAIYKGKPMGTWVTVPIAFQLRD